MPIYEYQREDGSVFEVLQKITEAPLSVCPTTGQKVKRLISESAFHLKGSGWYKTDYNAKAGTSASKSSGTDSSTPSSPPAKSESSSSSEASSSSSSGSSDGGGDKSKKACGTTCGCH